MASPACLENKVRTVCNWSFVHFPSFISSDPLQYSTPVTLTSASFFGHTKQFHVTIPYLPNSLPFWECPKPSQAGLITSASVLQELSFH